MRNNRPTRSRRSYSAEWDLQQFDRLPLPLKQIMWDLPFNTGSHGVFVRFFINGPEDALERLERLAEEQRERHSREMAKALAKVPKAERRPGRVRIPTWKAGWTPR